MADKLMSIIILNWNRLKYSKMTVETMVKKLTVPHVFILVDNNSDASSGVKDYLSSITTSNTNAEKVIHVFNTKNLGVAGGRNSGLIKANGDYLVTIDDDVLVPDNWDVLLTQACDKIPKLGITGVNVEPIKYTVQDINGVRVRPKTSGNLGGACLCLPRRVFNTVGYYRVYGQYGLEDSDMYVRLSHLGLMSAYIEPHGIHLDRDKDKVYRAVKNRAHKKGSEQLKAFAAAKIKYNQTKNVYVPYVDYDPDAPEWKNFESIDGTITAKIDLRALFDSMTFLKNMRIGNKLELVKKQSMWIVDTGAETREIDEAQAKIIKEQFKNYNIKYAEK